MTDAALEVKARELLGEHTEARLRSPGEFIPETLQETALVYYRIRRDLGLPPTPYHCLGVADPGLPVEEV